jgi:hypothetical protein
MMPQLEQGFLHPEIRSGTGKPQRLQVGGKAGERVGECAGAPTRCSLLRRRSDREALPASSATRLPGLAKPKRSGEKRIRVPLNTYGSLGSVAAVDQSRVWQGEKLGLNGAHQSG